LSDSKEGNPKKLDKFKEQVKKVDEELNKKTVELKNCDSNRAKSEKKLETVEKEIENLEKAMLKKNERKKTVEAEAKAIKEKEESLVAGVQEAKTKFEDMKGQSHEFEKEEKTLSKSKLSIENGLTDATNQLKGCQNFLRTHKDFQDKLELHDIPENLLQHRIGKKSEKVHGQNQESTNAKSKLFGRIQTQGEKIYKMFFNVYFFI
jgi:chromosome segregation ATPase